jgi:hypothetical protein
VLGRVARSLPPHLVGVQPPAAQQCGELRDTTGVNALGGPRTSLPSLLMVAGELDGELHERYPAESATSDFHEALDSIKNPASA